MKKLFLQTIKAGLVVALLLVFVLPSTASVNNGGFETGDFTGWTTNYTGSEPLDPWQVTDSGTDLFFSFISPHSGTYAAANGFDGDGPSYYTMYQDVVALGNTGYVSFWYHAQWDHTQSPRTLSVEVSEVGTGTIVANKLVLSTIPDAGFYDLGWLASSVSFPATQGKTYRIKFIEWIPQYFTGPAQIEFDDISISFGSQVPHVSDIQINAGANVPAYETAGGSPAKLANGQAIFLPQDYDGNGFDTYVVTDTEVIDGTTWYSIFLGSSNFVWVNGSQVIPLSE